MRISLIGYGKMGKEIKQLALSQGHTIARVFDRSRPLKPEDLDGSDVAIEFTEPSSAIKNIFMAFEAGVPIVTGTTGWFGRLPEVRQRCLNENQTLFYASNFSQGVYLFNALNKMLAGWMSKVDAYQPSIIETHHKEKKDAPSGTAITLAETLLGRFPQLKGWSDLEANEGKLYVQSVRKEGVPGTHRIDYTSEIDTISLEHTAHSRMGFVGGALQAAEWVQGKEGIFTIRDMMRDIVGELA